MKKTFATTSFLVFGLFLTAGCEQRSQPHSTPEQEPSEWRYEDGLNMHTDLPQWKKDSPNAWFSGSGDGLFIHKSEVIWEEDAEKHPLVSASLGLSSGEAFGIFNFSVTLDYTEKTKELIQSDMFKTRVIPTKESWLEIRALSKEAKAGEIFKDHSMPIIINTKKNHPDSAIGASYVLSDYGAKLFRATLYNSSNVGEHLEIYHCITAEFLSDYHYFTKDHQNKIIYQNYDTFEKTLCSKMGYGLEALNDYNQISDFD